MMEQTHIIRYNTPLEFQDDIRDYIDARYFGYIQFISVFNMAEQFYDLITIKRANKIDLIYMRTDEHSLLLGLQ
jgi:hypothetical protein